MTAFQQLLVAIETRGRVAAIAAVARTGSALVVRAGAELPDVRAEVVGDDVVLAAPGLRERAFGSRRAMPDPRLLGLVR